MAQGKSNAASDLELDTSVTESGAGNTGEQQNSGNQGNSGNGGQSGSGSGKNNVPVSDKKIGFAVFVQRANPNKYVIAMLKSKNAMKVHTLEEWQQIVTDLLNKKVS
jgi:hypothetical protein